MELLLLLLLLLLLFFFSGNPDSPDLAATVARALVTTHNYRLAVQYYQDAIKKVHFLSIVAIYY